jgi:toxin ParE1/3/4
MKLRWTRQAFADRDHMIDYIAKDNGVAAFEIDDKIVAAAEGLLLFPLMGRMGRVANTRELVVNQSNLIVAYQYVEGDDEIVILRVLHGAQNWPNSL